jgi:hypothetical protein
MSEEEVHTRPSYKVLPAPVFVLLVTEDLRTYLDRCYAAGLEQAKARAVQIENGRPLTWEWSGVPSSRLEGPKYIEWKAEGPSARVFSIQSRVLEQEMPR